MRAAAIFGVERVHHNNPRNIDNSTPTRPRPARPPLRPPLQARDHNAMRHAPQHNPGPLTAKSGNAMMSPHDKHGGGRPLMPTLSASAKTSNRAPLTPRVAGSTSAGVTSPLSRRPPRPETNTPVASREDLSTPVSSFLNYNNVTPRSGSRKTRVDSANSTPTSTPHGTPAPPSANEFARFAQESPTYGSGPGISGVDKDAQKRPTVSFGPAVSDAGHTSPSHNAESKFFLANDAKSLQSRPPLQSKSSSFFYASGESVEPPPQNSKSSAVGSNVGDERAQLKFFRASGTPDLSASPAPHFVPPKPTSTISTSYGMTSPRLVTSPDSFSPPQRPSSPNKLKQHASVPSLRNAPSLPSLVHPRPQAGGRGQSANNIVAARRVSLEQSQRPSHGRSASTGSSSPQGMMVSSGGSVEPLALVTPAPLMTRLVPVSTPEEGSEAGEPAKDDTCLDPQSPTKAGNSLEHMNELAANARRERKVLDLEITNSSLEAINRTLEREMRKQTAELRRYRRLSRSGRLSIATAGSSRISSGAFSLMDGTQLSDMSEEDSEEDDEDFDSSSDESVDDGPLSPRAMAESDARHRKKDEKRLRLDLSKHQQLLIDSQKMNQSLKRCLAWTGELINEGRKALEYHVRVSDVELGGRVLAPDEIEGENEHEASRGIGASLLQRARKAAKVGMAAAWGGPGRDDRDSGIEVDSERAVVKEQEASITPSPS